MTLVLSLANARLSIQIADGRFTGFDHRPDSPNIESDESVKCGSFTCGDARLAYSFTGLAYTGTFDNRTFDTRSWLRVALLRAADTSFHVEDIVQRLKQIVSRTFASDPAVLSVSPGNRRLSIMLTGFWNTNAGCIPAGWILTNYQRNFELGTGHPDLPEAEAEFRVWRWHQSVPDTEYTHVERLGDWRGVERERQQSLRTLLLSQAPIHALVQMGVSVLREASESFKTGARVGREASIIIVHRDVAVPIEFASDAASPRTALGSTDMVIATDSQNKRWVSLELEAVPTPDNPYHMTVPAVHRNAPCPCGSGRRYRECHKLRRPTIGR
jgi:hypothetical protein